jgi:UDPglucose 6-dehydrogenase
MLDNSVNSQGGDLEPVVKRREQKLKLGIIGQGFVGKAVDHAFTNDNIEKMVVDPKYSQNTLKDLCEWEPNLTFICLPTPSDVDGSVNTKDIDDAVMRLINLTDSFIVIKSTVPPNVIDRLSRIDTRIVYEPEFLTEANAKADMLDARFRVFGIQDQNAGQYLEGVYNNFSLCSPAQCLMMAPVEAAFFKYAVNNFLAMKITFMNQLKAVMDEYGGNYNLLSRALMADQRLGYSHMRIPGTDGKPGFGGSCFPKDLSGFINFVEKETSVDPKLLKVVRSINNEIRSEYPLSEREKEQNVNYGQTEEEQQDQDNGSPEPK